MPQRSGSGGGAARRGSRSRSVRLLRSFSLAVVLAAGCDSGLAAAPRLESLAIPAQPDAPESWKHHYEALSALGPGFVVWESKRKGKWRIWLRPLDGSPERQLSPDEPGRDHVAAHISPDGRHVVYLSLPAPHQEFDQLAPGVKAPLHLLRLDGTDVVDDRVLVESARTYQQSRAALWVNPRELIYLAPDATTRQRDIVTGTEQILIAKPQTRFGMLVNATHTHATNGSPTFSMFHENDQTVSRRERLPGCQPYFTADGRLGYWVADSGGPISKIDLQGGTSTAVLERDSEWLPKGHGYLYYPMASADQRLLAFSASRNKHGHFAVDFDVFVAPLDPERFEVTGPAVRITFGKEIDRFPDVFASGYELGRLHGEAPFEVTLHPDPDEPAEGWRFDFGDGTPGGADASHRFEAPGTYRLTAKRGGRTIGGEVRVTAGAPPRVVRAEVRPGGRKIAILFDELVDVEKAVVRFESGRALASAAAGERGRELIVSVPEPFSGTDTLHVEGIADRADTPHAMAPTSVPVEAIAWPGAGDGLAFVFGTDGAALSTVDVDTGHPRTFSFVAHGRARYGAQGVLRAGSGWFEAEDLPEGLVRTIRDANAFTIELTVAPDEVSTDDPMRILSLGFDEKSQNVSLSQHGRLLELRLRNEWKGVKDHAVVELGQLQVGEPNHFVVSYRPGQLTVVRNGQGVLDSDTLHGNLSVWREGAALAVGADPGGSRPFSGTVQGIALYARALDAPEAVAHANAYRHLLVSRPEVPRLRLRGKLAEESPPPTPEQIIPYREALVMREYEVPPRKRDRLGGERVRVAHWAVLDGRAQPMPKLGPRGNVALVLEPWEAYPRLESAYLSDTLDPDPEMPIYVEVSN